MKLILESIESFRIAWSAIVANKGRGALTALGIIIGIVAVTTTMTAFNGMQSSFRQAAGAIGADVVYVSRMPWITMNNFFEFRNRPNLNMAEAQALEEAFKGRAIVSPSMETRRRITTSSARRRERSSRRSTPHRPRWTGWVCGPRSGPRCSCSRFCCSGC